MDDAVFKELIRRINVAHPDWDLSFLTKVETDPKASEVERNCEAAGGEEAEVDPELEGGISVMTL